MVVLKGVLNKHPGDRAILFALVSFSRIAGDAEAALGYAEQLAVIAPDDRSWRDSSSNCGARSSHRPNDQLEQIGQGEAPPMFL